MRLLVAALLAAGLGACRQDEAPQLSFWQESHAGGIKQRLETRTDGRVIDAAAVLSEADKQRIGRRAGEVSRQTGLEMLVLTVRLTGRESMDHFGWAVGGNGKRAPVMLMINPDKGSVRVESGGKVSAEQSAGVASAMQPGLRSGRTADAVLAGLDRLAAVDRAPGA